MFAVVITEKGGAQRRMDFDKNEVTIGRVQGNDIVLPKGNVSKRHSRIVLKDGRFIVVDLKSTNGTYVNGRKITSPLVVKTGDKIYIGDFIMTLEEEAAAEAAAPPPAAPPARPGPPPLRPHAAPPSQPPPAPHQPPPPLPSQPQAAPKPMPAQAAPQPMPHAAPQPVHATPPAAPAAVMPHSEPPGDSFGLAQEPPDDVTPTPAPMPTNRPTAPPRSRARSASGPVPSAPIPTLSGGTFGSLMARVGVAFPVADVSAAAMHDADRWSRAGAAIDAALAAMASSEGFGGASRDDLAALALKEAVGLGALDDLVANDEIVEIIVEGPGRVLADTGDGLKPTGTAFSSAAALKIVALRLLGGDSGEGAIRHATLPGGAHATVIFAPVAVGGPMLEIRRGRHSSGLDDLIARGTLDAEMAELLKRAVSSQQNIAVVGPASSGVSTMLGALASAIDASERMVLVEGHPDIRLDREQVVALHASGTQTVGELARQASGLRCERLVIDDVCATDTLAALQVMASRGEGAMSGFHAAGGEDPFTPLKVLASLGQGSSTAGLDALIATAVDVVVRMGREDGARRVLGIIEVTGVDAGIVQTQVLYEYADGFSSTGATPGF